MTDTITNIATLAGLFLYTIAVIVGFLVAMWLLYFIVTETKRFIIFCVDETVNFLDWSLRELGKGFVALIAALPSLIWMMISKALAGATDIHTRHKKSQAKNVRQSAMPKDEYVKKEDNTNKDSPNEAEQIARFYQED